MSINDFGDHEIDQKRWQISLRGVVFIITLLAIVLGGRLSNPLCILLASIGLFFFWIGLNDNRVRLIGIISGLGWVGLAVMINYLAHLPSPALK